MGSKPKPPPPPPAPPPVPKTADAFDAGQQEMIRRRKGSSYNQSFLAGNPLGGAPTQTSGNSTSFLGG